MRRALWIDDDQRLLTRAAIALGDAGITVVFAPDLAHALDRLKTEAWDHVIIDVGIGAGDLEIRHPDAFEALDFEHETTGLELAKLLVEAPAPLGRSPESVIICSGFQHDYLASVAPELMAKLAFVSKSSKAFLESRFISEISAALGVTSVALSSAHGVTSVAPHVPVDAAAEFELLYLDLYHDLKVAVRSSLPALRRISERFHEHAGGRQGQLEAGLAAVESLGIAVVDEAFSARGVNTAHLAAVEDVLALLTEKRSQLQATGYVDLTRLSDNLLLKVARLPMLASTDALHEACRALQARLCAIEIDKVSARLVSEISTQKHPDMINNGSSFDSSAVLTSILDFEEPNAVANRTAFDRDITPGIIIHTEKSGQSLLYRRAISNIIDNAVKYSGRLPESNTWIIVRHTSSQKWCTTSVENWGAPIYPDELTDIFTPGRRGERARKHGEGRGLGIAYGCIKALGGTITPKSIPASRGNATNTFTVQLPLLPQLQD